MSSGGISSTHLDVGGFERLALGERAQQQRHLDQITAQDPYAARTEAERLAKGADCKANGAAQALYWAVGACGIGERELPG